MNKLSVFDPVQCCSTGVCGPDADDELAQFASSLEWLKSKGVEVERFNLGFQPGEFASNTAVKARLDNDGMECLPMLIADGEVVKTGGYPSRDELASTFDLEAPEMAVPKKSSGCCG